MIGYDRGVSGINLATDGKRRQIGRFYQLFSRPCPVLKQISQSGISGMSVAKSHPSVMSYSNDDDDDDKLYLTTLTLSAKAGFHNGRVKYKYVFTSK